MDNESPELIEANMQQTRASLTDKVAALEGSVLGTFQSATTAVQDTVASVRDAVQDTMHSVKGTVEDTVHTVTDTMHSVTDSVQESVATASDTLKETFDPRPMIREKPWAMVGGAAAAGLLAGLCLFRKSSPSRREERLWDRSPRSYSEEPRPLAAPAPAHSGKPTFMDQVWNRVQQELDKVAERVHEEFEKVTEKAIASVSGGVQKVIDEGVPRFVDHLVETATPTFGHHGNGRLHEYKV